MLLNLSSLRSQLKRVAAPLYKIFLLSANVVTCLLYYFLLGNLAFSFENLVRSVKDSIESELEL